MSGIPESLRRKGRKAVWMLVFAAAAESFFALLSFLTLKNFGSLLRFAGERFFPGEPLADSLAEVFSALKKAHIEPRTLLPFLLCLAGAALAFSASKGRRGFLRRAALRAGCAVLLLSALFLTLWMTDVNGIRFGDVLLSLVRAARSGALDSLSAAEAAAIEVI